MASRSLNVQITGDAKGLGVATRQADGHMDHLGKSGAKMGKMMAGGFALAGAAAAGALVVGLKKSVDAAMEAEKSQARLQAQLKASGASYRAHSKEIESVIQKHSQLAGVDDEDLQDAFTGILRATGSVTTAMKDMGLVTDLMRGKNMDAAKAGDLLAKVHNGNVGALKRMGVAIDPVTKAQDKLKESNQKATVEQVRAAKEADKTATSQKALAELQKRFGGQAEAYGKTAAGAQERFGVAVENLQEKIGAKLLPVVANITNKVADFVGGMESGKGAGGRFADAISNGMEKAREIFSRVGEAVGRVKDTVSDWVSKNRGDINSVVSAFKLVGRFAKDVFLDTLLPIVKRSFKTVGEVISGLASVVRGVVRTVSGLFSGDWDKAWSGMKEVVRGAFKVVKSVVVNQIENLLEVLKDLGPQVIRLIGRGLKGLGTALRDGIISGVKLAAREVPGLIGDALKGLGKAITAGIKAGFGKLNPFGDGFGQPFGDGSGFTGAVNLKGADPDLYPIAAVGASNGLHVSSGIRPGSITSSGNVSYHASGDAVDMAGPFAAMRKTAVKLYNTWGPRLRELISPWADLGIKDGKPFRFSSKIQADHSGKNAHVHAAFTGPFGDGIGDAARDAFGAGLRGQKLIESVAIAGAESGYDEDTQNLKYPDHSIGYWQINQLAHKGRFGTDAQLKHGAANARAMVAISREAGGWSPWSTWPTAAQGYMDKARAAVASLTGTKAGGGKSKNSKGGTSRGPGGNVTPAFYEPADISEEQQRAQDFRDRTGPFAFRPIKGGGPTKGFTPDEVARGLPEMAQARMFPEPPQFGLQTEFSDTISLQEAQAALTDDKGDDITAAKARLWEANVLVDRSKGFGTGAQAEALRNLKSVKDALESLENTIKQDERKLAEALDGLRVEMKRQTDFAASVQSTDSFQLKKYLAELLGGQVVQGAIGRSFTPGSGVEYSY